MEKNQTFWQSPLIKVGLIAFLAILMMIPLSMIRSQVAERSAQHANALHDISGSWGTSQTFSGPWISYKYLTTVKDEKETVKAELYPDSLKYVVNSTTQVLHRSIYDVPVYTADIRINGTFTLDSKLPEASGAAELILEMGELKGIQGHPTFTVCGEDLKVQSGSNGIRAELPIPEGAEEGDVLPFSISMRLNGSESIYFKPVGNLTEVMMESDYPDPSFGGDYLPVERSVREDGFSARWLVSQITMTSSSTNSFGVRLVKPVTQYLVIGASLVLFYSLLLAFSDFLSFGVSYLIASVMTTVSLGAYFIGIAKGKWAFLLTALVALAYGVIYVLLQMETYAFLAGTLLLFLILCVIMYLTRNLKLGTAAEEK